jgi:hypothetical protein
VSITVRNTAQNGDTTLVFLTYNLGANPNLTPKEQMAYQSAFAFTNETRTDITVYGGLYQWGRKDAAHSFRCDYADPANHPDLFTPDLYTSETLYAADKFVWDSSGSNVSNNFCDWYFPHDDASTTLWGNGKTVENGGNASPTAGTNNPCPSGFRVPTQYEWALLGNEGGSSTSTSGDSFSVPNANGTPTTSGLVWVPVKNGVPSTDWTSDNPENTSLDNYGNNNGYALYTSDTWQNGFTDSDKTSLIDPDDPEPLMFLPAAGNRHYDNGRVCGAGGYGNYWSSIVGSDAGQYVYFSRSEVNATYGNNRAYGLSVRCLSEF